MIFAANLANYEKLLQQKYGVPSVSVRRAQKN
jgi:hypothetical protein